MQGFLQILGGCTLLALVAIVVGFLILRHRFKRFKGDLESMVYNATPGILTLEPRAKVDWKDAKKATDFSDDLMLHGFQSDGLYEAAQLPRLFLHGFVNPSRSLLAVVYEHPMAGVIVDIVQKMADGRHLTVTTVVQGGELDSMPGKTSIRLPDADIAQLMAAWEANRLEGETLSAEPGIFKDSFEKSYREETTWRATRGGPTADELHRVALASGESYDPETEELTFQLQRRQANAQLDEILRKKFLEESGVSAVEWEDIQHRLTIIHDNLLREELEDYLSIAADDERDQDFIDDEEEEDELGFELPDMPGRNAFATVNATFAADRQFTLRWECDEPIAADFYLEPK